MCSVALAVPSLDDVGWYSKHFIVVRQGSSVVCASFKLGSSCVGGRVCVELRELPVCCWLNCGNGIDLGSDDVMWIELKDVLINYEMLDLGCEYLALLCGHQRGFSDIQAVACNLSSVQKFGPVRFLGRKSINHNCNWLAC